MNGMCGVDAARVHVLCGVRACACATVRLHDSAGKQKCSLPSGIQICGAVQWRWRCGGPSGAARRGDLRGGEAGGAVQQRQQRVVQGGQHWVLEVHPAHDHAPPAPVPMVLRHRRRAPQAPPSSLLHWGVLSPQANRGPVTCTKKMMGDDNEILIFLYI